MDNPAEKPSRPRSVFRKIVFTLGGLIAFLALFLGLESWRSATALKRFMRDREAKGETFDPVRLIPPKVPDNENFAMTPLLAPIFTLPIEDARQPFKPATATGYGLVVPANLATNLHLNRFDKAVLTSPPWELKFGQASDFIAYAAVIQNPNTAVGMTVPMNPAEAAAIVLDDLKLIDPFLNQLRTDAARPQCQFNVDYQNIESDKSPYMAHLFVLKWLFPFLNFHAKAELVSGHSDEALKDLNVIFRIDDGLKEEPLVMSQFIRNMAVNYIWDVTDEGLAEHRWSGDQLRLLQDRLQKTDLIKSTVKGLLGDRDITGNPDFNRSATRLPGDWTDSRRLDFYREFEGALLARINMETMVISPTINRSIDAAWKEGAPRFPHVLMSPYSILTRMKLESLKGIPRRAAFNQTEVDMTMLACALERYRLAKGSYPDALTELVPRFINGLPHDIINGQPLRYRRTNNGRFIVYSIGWNEKDDGGVIATQSDNHKLQNIDQGDWVWQYPDNP